MRPIKFRIPFFNSKDGSFSHFGYWGAIDNNGKPIDDHGSFYSPSQSSACSKGWHEQFTGLLDKNGNNSFIFEGDIISLDGIIIGNKHEKAGLLSDKTNLLIEGFGGPNWCSTVIEALARGCYYAQSNDLSNEVRKLE